MKKLKLKKKINPPSPQYIDKKYIPVPCCGSLIKGVRETHCPTCCRTFSSYSAFDFHLKISKVRSKQVKANKKGSRTKTVYSGGNVTCKRPAEIGLESEIREGDDRHPSREIFKSPGPDPAVFEKMKNNQKEEANGDTGKNHTRKLKLSK